MARRTTQYAVLGGLLILLIGELAYQFWPGATPQSLPDAVPIAAPARDVAPRASAPGTLAVPDVKTAALSASSQEPDPSVRNPFRLKPKPVPPPPPLPPALVRPGASADNPNEPPPPPPITLRFIGLVTAGGSVGKIAVLTNGSDVFYGREGDIVDGRYKIVTIGAESVVVAYADGRGTRRIPLTGS